MKNLDKRYSNQNDNSYGEITPARLNEKRGTIDFTRKRIKYLEGDSKTQQSDTNTPQ